jgi:hypothetical protein
VLPSFDLAHGVRLGLPLRTLENDHGAVLRNDLPALISERVDELDNRSSMLPVFHRGAIHHLDFGNTPSSPKYDPQVFPLGHGVLSLGPAPGFHSVVALHILAPTARPEGGADGGAWGDGARQYELSLLRARA